MSSASAIFNPVGGVEDVRYAHTKASPVLIRHTIRTAETKKREEETFKNVFWVKIEGLKGKGR